jgi:hypothetical protein
MEQSSYPEVEGKYGWIRIVNTTEDQTTKLKIGTLVSNLLVTSSIRLDKNSMNNGIAEIGSNTTDISINVESLQQAKLLIENESCSCINRYHCLSQLRQVRSKFHCLSTYLFHQ